MVNRVRSGLSVRERHLQRIQRSLGLQVRPHTPAHDLARAQVHHTRQVQPAFFGSYVGQVRQPHFIELLDLELSVEQVRRDPVFMKAVRQPIPLFSVTEQEPCPDCQANRETEPLVSVDGVSIWCGTLAWESQAGFQLLEEHRAATSHGIPCRPRFEQV